METDFDPGLILHQFYITWLERDMQLTEEEFLTKYSGKDLALKYEYGEKGEKWANIYFLVNKKEKLSIMSIPESTKTSPKTQLLIAYIIAVEAFRSLYGAIIVPTLMKQRVNWVNEVLANSKLDETP